MRVARRPEDLGTGSLLFAPRLAPRLRFEDGALDFGLPELSAVAADQVQALLAGRVEMRGKPLLVLLVFVSGSRPLMIQADKLRVDSFELESAAPLENLRTLITHLGATMDLVTDATTEAFAAGSDMPDLGKELIPLSSWLGELVAASPEKLAEALGIEAPEALDEVEDRADGLEEEEAVEPVETDAEMVSGASEPPAAPEASPVEPRVGPAERPDPEPAAPESAAAAMAAAPETSPPAPAEAEAERNGVGRLWLDLARQQLVTIGEGYLLVARRNARELRSRSEAVRSGRDPRVVFGTDALTIAFPEILQVRNMVASSRLELVYRRGSGKIREVIDYSSPEEGERMFEQLAELLGPRWKRGRVTLSRWQALYQSLRWPLVAAAALGLVLGVLALRPAAGSPGSEPGQTLPSLDPYGVSAAGLVLLCLVLVPVVRGLRQRPPVVDELVPGAET